MQRCNSCGRSVRRGWTGGMSGHQVTHCLVCWTARVMTTFVWLPKTKKGQKHASRTESPVQAHRKDRRRET